MALVSVHKDGDAPSTVKADTTLQSHIVPNDADILRATDLVELHHDVKLKHTKGDDAALKQAQKDVDAVSRILGRRSLDRGVE